MICYNCSKKLDRISETKEHIPAKSLFEGYDESYKVNRITVSACKECNGKYSPTDEEFRNMMGIISEKTEDKKITEKSVSSVLRKDKQFERLCFNSFGKVSGVTFSQGTIEEFHIKNFKGLFMYEYGIVLPEKYTVVVNMNENDWSETMKGILGFFELFDWKFSGHPDIFQYKLQPLRIGIRNNDKSDLKPTDNEPFFVGLLYYKKQHVALVLANNKF
jgi:hypothetical protein